MTEYDPLFWDIETLGFDPMEPPAWTDEMPDFIIGIAWGHMKEGWRNCDEWDQVDIEVNSAVVDGVDGSSHRWEVFSAEHELLDDVFGVMSMMHEDVMYMANMGRDPIMTTWNGRNFDHPFTACRLGRHRLPASPVLNRYRRLDMMRPCANDYGNSHAVSEDDYLEYLGLENDDEFTGGDMWDEFNAGRLENVRSHGVSDVTQMMEVFFTKRDMMYEHFYDHYDDLGDPPILGDVMDFDGP